MPRKHPITYEPEYKDKPIMTDKEKRLGCMEPVLQQLERQFDAMTSKHSKVLFIRYDVRFPADMPPVHDNCLLYTSPSPRD